MVPAHHGAEALAALVVSAQKSSRFKNKVILILLTICVFSLSWNAVQNWTRPEPRLLATTADGRFMPLPLLDAPIESRSTLANWAKRNIPPLYEFNYSNFRGELNKNLSIMRPQTLQSFQEMLNTSGILPKVRNEFLILRANMANEPLVLGTEVYQGVRIWIIETPLNLIYESGNVENGQRERIVQRIVFRSWVARANPMEYDGGLMLAKFSVQPRKEDR
jgi:intracellular multiplication protein IcmL